MFTARAGGLPKGVETDFSDVQWLEVDGLKVRYLKGPERTGVPLVPDKPLARKPVCLVPLL